MASNVFSLAQAWLYYGYVFPFAIYADDVLVGFVMMGHDKEAQRYTIWRFMIDAKYQKNGYGKTALNMIIEYMKKEFSVKEIFLSFEPDNKVAEKLYIAAGFKKTGEMDGDEIVMRLEIKK